MSAIQYQRADKLLTLESLYPRDEVNQGHVMALVEAIEQGAELPPLLVNAATWCVVDGQHRLHAFRTVKGAKCQVPVLLKTYQTDAEMFADAISENSRHGLRFNGEDYNRVVRLAAAFKITVDRLQPLLQVSADTLRNTPRCKSVVNLPVVGAKKEKRQQPEKDSDGKTRHDRRYGPSTDDKQARASYYAQNLALLLDNRIVDGSYRELVKDLAKLKISINEYLARGQA